ncbi:serine hydrolase [Limibacter armeniacum]|uniref:serine hydrolase n=1 Tax=Limibacter armeniacum TaxID=466084 RepID=UPI002FE62005
MRLILTLFLFVSLIISAQCQITLSGSVVNNQTKAHIPYANIGIANTEVGTISNEDGTFLIHIPSMYVNQELLFSSVGYIRKSIPIASLSKRSELLVSLDENVIELREMEVLAKREKMKSKVLGNGKSLLLTGQLHYDTLSAGSAMALLIDKTGNEDLTFLTEGSLYIAKNLSPEFKIRLRVMAVDPLSKQPTTDLLAEQIIKTSDLKKGWLDFELKGYQLIEEAQFFIVFEWIMDKADREYVAKKYEQYIKSYPDRVSFDTVIVNDEKVSIPRVSTVVAGTVFGVTKSQKDREKFICYYRSNSFGEWKRSSGILSAKVTLSNYPVENSVSKKESPCWDLACKVDSWAEAFKNEYSIPGLQLSIGKLDTIIVSKGYGFSDIKAAKKVDRNTQFRVASVSKTMTLAAIMQLNSKGLLQLDTAIQQYVPAFPNKEYSVSIRQLAGHLGGIRGYYGKSWDEIFIQQHYKSLSDALNIFKNDPLAVKPGTEFLYSSYGYILLGAAIENITSQPYLSYMKQHVWNPLNMLSTYGDVSDSLMENKSKFYYLNGEEAAPYDLSYAYSTGGLVSTSDDLVKFGLALTQNSFFKEEIKKQFFETQYTAKGLPTGYGLGWYVTKDSQNKTVWYHTGELPSSGSILLIYPDDKVVIALLANAPIVTETEDHFLSEVLALVETIQSL